MLFLIIFCLTLFCGNLNYVLSNNQNQELRENLNGCNGTKDKLKPIFCNEIYDQNATDHRNLRNNKSLITASKKFRISTALSKRRGSRGYKIKHFYIISDEILFHVEKYQNGKKVCQHCVIKEGKFICNEKTCLSKGPIFPNGQTTVPPTTTGGLPTLSTISTNLSRANNVPTTTQNSTSVLANTVPTVLNNITDNSTTVPQNVPTTVASSATNTSNTVSTNSSVVQNLPNTGESTATANSNTVSTDSSVVQNLPNTKESTTPVNMNIVSTNAPDSPKVTTAGGSTITDSASTASTNEPVSQSLPKTGESTTIASSNIASTNAPTSTQSTT